MSLFSYRSLSFEPPEGWDEASILSYDADSRREADAARIPHLAVRSARTRDNLQTVSARMLVDVGQRKRIQVEMFDRLEVAGAETAGFAYALQEGIPLRKTVTLVRPTAGSNEACTFFTMTMRPQDAGAPRVLAEVLRTVHQRGSGTPSPSAVMSGELSFVPPSGWSDGTCARFRSRKPAAGTLLFAMDRPLRDEPLRAHVERKLVQLGKGTPEMKLLEMTTKDIGGRRAIRIQFSWVHGGRSVAQDLALVDRDAEPMAPLVVLNMTAPFDRSGPAREAFARTLSSLRFV
jgi:hypothetical protein